MSPFTTRRRRAVYKTRPDLFAMLARRLEAGRIEYGDKSVCKSFATLVGEIREEVADVLGWYDIVEHKFASMGRPVPGRVKLLGAALRAGCVTLWAVLEELDDELARVGL